MFNVIRTEQAPISLAAKRKYNSQDVLIELNNIFHKKCYLCETKEPLDINIEHFIPHLDNEELKFNWNNLYLSCSRCNNIKLTKYDNLIDCCDPDVNVLKAIKHHPPTTPFAKNLKIEAQIDDEKTRLTAELINKIFNSEHTPNKTCTAVSLRKNVFAQFNKFLDLQQQYFNETALPHEKETALERMKLLIQASSAYSSFICWCVLEDTELEPLLVDFIGA